MQFEVLAHRMGHEFGVQVEVWPTPHSLKLLAAVWRSSLVRQSEVAPAPADENRAADLR